MIHSYLSSTRCPWYWGCRNAPRVPGSTIAMLTKGICLRSSNLDRLLVRPPVDRVYRRCALDLQVPRLWEQLVTYFQPVSRFSQIFFSFSPLCCFWTWLHGGVFLNSSFYFLPLLFLDRFTWKSFSQFVFLLSPLPCFWTWLHGGGGGDLRTVINLNLRDNFWKVELLGFPIFLQCLKGSGWHTLHFKHWGENDGEDIDIKSDNADVSDTDDDEKVDDNDDIISKCDKIKILTWARELSCRAPLADW